MVQKGRRVWMGGRAGMLGWPLALRGRSATTAHRSWDRVFVISEVDRLIECHLWLRPPRADEGGGLPAQTQVSSLTPVWQ